MTKNLVAMVAMALLAAPIAANALPIQWALNGAVSSSNGLGAVSGSFNYDADTMMFSDIALSTPLEMYTVFLGTNFNGHMVFGRTAGDTDYGLFLQPILLSSLTNAGGTLNLTNGLIADALCFQGCLGGGSARSNWFGATLTGRALPTSVPEPGTLALFGLSIAGLGFARRRRATN